MSSPSPTPSPAERLFRAGQLSESLRAQIEVVRDAPADLAARSFLFALFCFTGDLHRAGLALAAIASQAEHLELETATLRSLLAAEAERREVLTQKGSPLLPPDAPTHVEARVRAVSAARSGDLVSAVKHLDEALEQTPPVHAEINGTVIEAVRDDDDLLGSVLEVFAAGRYTWLPLESIRQLELSAPKGVLDLVWTPAHLTTQSGIEASIYIPALYHASHEESDEALQLGRATVWLDQGNELFRGRGQRMLRGLGADGEHEWPLLELRSWKSIEEPDAS